MIPGRWDPLPSCSGLGAENDWILQTPHPTLAKVGWGYLLARHRESASEELAECIQPSVATIGSVGEQDEGPPSEDRGLI